MKKFKKILLFILFVFMLSGCVKDEANKIVENNEGNNEKLSEVKVIDVNSKTKPYAVMINCLNEALPQTGLQNAYIVYELRVEGGITRMMALFKDKDIDKIGSIRSARIQYLGYALENDAIFVHAGGADDALAMIKSEKITDIDADGKYGFRDTELRKSGVAFEHTLFTSTEKLAQGVSDKKISATSDNGNLLKYSPEEIDYKDINGAIKANNVSIKYSNYRTSNYKYDETNKVYLRSMNDKPNVDRVTGEQYTVKNIIAYGVKYTNYCTPDGSYCKYNKIDNIGTGEGYYITNGYAIPITWEKKDLSSKTVYKVKETSKEIIVNDGNTYIQIYPDDQKLTIS